jgi:hypothetical protein
MRTSLSRRLREGGLAVEQQKKLLGSLAQLDGVEGDPAWEAVQTRYRLTFELMEAVKARHAALDSTQVSYTTYVV